MGTDHGLTHTHTIYMVPHMKTTLNIDDTVMARLNASVDVDKKTIEAVSTQFLKDAGLN